MTKAEILAQGAWDCFDSMIRYNDDEQAYAEYKYVKGLRDASDPSSVIDQIIKDMQFVMWNWS